MKDRITTLIAIIIIIPIAALFLMFVWAWVVPDVFSGMVAQELLPATITFEQSFKLLTLIGLLNLATVLGTSLSSKTK